jgi:tRNA pseudouridine38-40 synthase
VSDDGTTVLTVSYDGGPFAGFARQPGQVTVQGRLEESLAIALRREVVTSCAGRTDSGVHALGQVVSFPSAPSDVPNRDLLRSLNALAGKGIAIVEARSAPTQFDARHSAVAREYRYRLVTSPAPPLFLHDYAWWIKDTLDLGAMRAAGVELVGQHDFRSFCVAGSAEGKRTVRTIDLLEVEPANEMGEHCIVVRIVGRSFLHSMVRIVVGSLVQVARGRRSVRSVAEALETCERAAAGPTAPPHGLTLWHVTYPEELWL